MRKRAYGALIGLAVILAGCGGSSGGGGGKATITPPASSALYKAGTLTIGSDISYPPQESYKEGTKEPEGFDIDIGNAIAAKLGLKVEWINQTFEGIIPSLDARKYDIIISAMTINDERKQKVDFIPYFKAGESFVITKGGSKKPTKLEDLCGLTVAVEKGTAEESEVLDLNDAGKQGKCASNKVKLQSFTVDTEALAQLKKGAVDVHFTDSSVAGYEIKHNDGIAISGGVIEIAPEGIAYRKGEKAIGDPVAKAFQALKDDGTYKTLLKKWGLEDGDIDKS